MHLSRIQAACGDPGASRASLEEAAACLARAPDPGNVAERLENARRELAAPRPDLAGEKLSERERDVLRLLATELTQREIGVELYVSLNTVKTHTKHIFRKLDVADRRQAVARAHELGLI
jgi:LuxR family maltose regulon positive regulatory protein